LLHVSQGVQDERLGEPLEGSFAQCHHAVGDPATHVWEERLPPADSSPVLGNPFLVVEGTDQGIPVLGFLIQRHLNIKGLDVFMSDIYDVRVVELLWNLFAEAQVVLAISTVKTQGRADSPQPDAY